MDRQSVETTIHTFRSSFTPFGGLHSTLYKGGVMGKESGGGGTSGIFQRVRNTGIVQREHFADTSGYPWVACQKKYLRNFQHKLFFS